jgi:cysteinyl-tRNA synthetase
MSEAMTGLRLYNTLTRTKEDFVPIDPENVRMYACGPTVYDFAHIGNARPVIVFDVLFRLLRHLYGEDHVTYVRNITDVDDKINARAARDYPGLPLNEAIRKVTEETNAQFQADVKALGCLEPSFQPRATEHIDEMKAMIERLVARGVAYVAEGHVLFQPYKMSTLPKAPIYGALGRRSLDEMIAGARVDVAPYKREAVDFVLWKPSKEGEPGWPSPAGIDGFGRPGWHIECSAMSMAKLLEPFGGGLQCDDPEKNVFDIHAGGIDLVFPHHENEIAQSCCAFGTDRMANVWMHNGFLQVEGRKMAKSEGNFVTINELLNNWQGYGWPGEALRFNMLRTHYRQPIDWTLESLDEAHKTLWDWYGQLENVAVDGEVPSTIVDSLKDDLNTPKLLSDLHKLHSAGDFSGLLTSLRFLGFSGERAKIGRIVSAVGVVAGVASVHAVGETIVGDVNVRLDDVTVEASGRTHPSAEQIEARMNERLALIREKNWAEADKIRDELLAQGIQLKDGKDPATGERVTTWEVKR